MYFSNPYSLSFDNEFHPIIDNVSIAHNTIHSWYFQQSIWPFANHIYSSIPYQTHYEHIYLKNEDPLWAKVTYVLFTSSLWCIELNNVMLFRKAKICRKWGLTKETPFNSIFFRPLIYCCSNFCVHFILLHLFHVFEI